MPDTPAVPFFDGHNDALLRLFMAGPSGAERRFLDGEDAGHIDLPRAREGGMAGGLFAVWCPAPGQQISITQGTLWQGPYDRPLPPPLVVEEARAITLTQTAMMLRIERASGGAVTICRTAGAVRDAVARGSLAVVLHLEGADGMDEDLDLLHVLHAAGLRSLGPVWSRVNAFGHGVPMRFPSSPDTGPGLTEVGERLVRACNALGIMIDLSHITEKGFWDVARISTAPLVATHSNVHALCPHPRNLLPRQLEAIKASDGMVGLNLATAFLRPDGEMWADTELDVVVRHMDGLVEALGGNPGRPGIGFRRLHRPAGHHLRRTQPADLRRAPPARLRRRADRAAGVLQLDARAGGDGTVGRISEAPSASCWHCPLAHGAPLMRPTHTAWPSHPWPKLKAA